jgi:hypothetical protein
VISKNVPNARRYIAMAEQNLDKKSQDDIKLQDLKKELDRILDKE